MTVNIKVTNLNGTRNIPVTALNEQAIYPSLPSGMAVLRYIPQTDDVWVTGVNEVYMQGDIYATTEEMIQYLPFTVECSFKDVSFVNIYAKKQADSIFLMVGKKIPYTNILTFALLDTDFALGDDIDVKVVDYDNANTYDTVSGTLIATITIDTYPVETPLATNFTVSGKCNLPDGSELTLRFTSLTGFQEYTVVVNSGAWTRLVAQIDAAHTFLPNQSIDIRIYDDNTYVEIIGAFSSIATVTMEAPALTAGTEGTITGTSNGSVVDVYSRVSSPEGAWELFDGTVAVDESGNWTATGTIATAGTRDFVAVDTTDPDGFVQVDDVTVASGYEEGKIMIAVPATTNNPLKYSNDFGANFVTKGAQMPYIWLDINESGSHAICINAQGVYTVINGIYATAINSAKNWHMCAISKTGQYMVAVYGTTNTTGGIYISSDYGATWSETKTGVGGYAVCMSENGDKIAVFVYQGKSWFSSDYGQNWTERGATKAWAYSQNSRPCMSKDGAYVYAITTDKDYVYRFSSNGSSVTAVMPSKNYNSISCSEDGSKLVAGVYNENLYYSSNYGSSNSSIKSGGFRHVVMSGNGNYIAVCDNSQSNLSVAQTPFSSWADKGGSGFNCIRISYSGQYIIAVTGTSGNLFRSINYGANFGNVALGNNNWSTCVMNTKR